MLYHYIIHFLLVINHDIPIISPSLVLRPWSARYCGGLRWPHQFLHTRHSFLPEKLGDRCGNEYYIIVKMWKYLWKYRCGKCGMDMNGIVNSESIWTVASMEKEWKSEWIWMEFFSLWTSDGIWDLEWLPVSWLRNPTEYRVNHNSKGPQS